jgi:hypothetical protein
MNTLSDPMKTIRKAYPEMRRTRATAIVHSGEKRTVFGCLCGAYHTTSTDWNGRNAKHVREWREKHDACAARIAARLETDDEVGVNF